MMSADELTHATGHELRRRILDTMLATRESISPTMLADELDEPIGNVSYHMRILKDTHAVRLVSTRQRRGAIEHFYALRTQDRDRLKQMLGLVG